MNAPRSPGQQGRSAVFSPAFVAALIACAGLAGVQVSGPPVIWAAVVKKPPQPRQVQALRVKIPADPFASVGGRFRRLARLDEKRRNWHRALARWGAVAELEPKNKEAKRRISAIQSLLKRNSRKHFEKGQALLKRKSVGKAFSSFLRALSYDPNNSQALAMVKYELNAKSLIEYKIVKGDTIREIAVAEYEDPEMTFLVLYYNDIKDPRKIEINQILKLPVMDGVFPTDEGTQAAVATTASPPTEARKAVSPLVSALTPSVAAAATLSEFPGAAENDDSGEKAAIKYQEAKKLYDEGDFMKAATAAQEVLEQDAANGGARDLVNAAYYAEGTRLQGQNKNVAAMQNLSRVDPGYKDASQRVEKLQVLLKDQQAEIHYIAGVTFFLNEDLDKAIREWELVLKIEPSHPQASKDMENAKALQAKLSQLQ